MYNLKSETKRNKVRSGCLQSLINGQIQGKFNKKAILNHIGKRHFYLHDIVPCEQVLSHIFLGFTQNGQNLLSYCFESKFLYLYVWIFNFDKPLILLAKHCVFSTESRNFEDLYESTAVYVYQWPSDDKHLLVLTIPEHPQPSVIKITVLNVDHNESYVLSPGTITYSVVGWGQRHRFFDRKDKRGFEDYLTPGILMFYKSICTFHTGTEIVCLKIQQIEKGNHQTKVLPNILDIETVLVETLEENQGDEFTSISTYELLVCGIECKPTTIYAFVHSVITDRANFQSFREFVVKWDADKSSYEVIECDIVLKENGRKKAYINLVLEQFIKTQETSDIYFLDNMQFVECQTSFDALKSPVDNVYVTLSCYTSCEF